MSKLRSGSGEITPPAPKGKVGSVYYILIRQYTMMVQCHCSACIKDCGENNSVYYIVYNTALVIT